jgi:DNA repair protein SbcD/Mre11
MIAVIRIGIPSVYLNAAQTMRIALFSDLHLDAPFAWAGPEAARKRRQSLRDTLVRILDLALAQQVDAICCGGDLYEHDRVSPDTGSFLRSQFARAGNIPVFIAPGNHDWLGPDSLYRQVSWPLNVKFFDGRLAATELDDGLTLWSGAHTRAAGTPGFLDGFKVDRGGVHLALFHGSASGQFFEEGKQPHAPFRAEQIDEAGLHFAMLGHFHSPRHERNFVYPGNPDPLAFGELGSRGVVILTVASSGAVSVERHSVSTTKVTDVQLDITGCGNKQEVLARASTRLTGLDGFVRIIVRGDLDPSIDLHPTDIADLPTILDARPVVHLECTAAYDLDKLTTEPTVRGQFVRDVQASNLSEDEKRRVLITGLRALDGRDDLEVF